MTYKYEVVDMMGRRWDRTLVASKAVKVAAQVEKEKGLKCQVKQIAIQGDETNVKN